MEKFRKSVKISQSYRECKGGNFFETQCSSQDILTLIHKGHIQNRKYLNGVLWLSSLQLQLKLR